MYSSKFPITYIFHIIYNMEHREPA